MLTLRFMINIHKMDSNMDMINNWPEVREENQRKMADLNILGRRLVKVYFNRIFTSVYNSSGNKILHREIYHNCLLDL